MWKLVIEDDEGKRTVVPLTRDDYTIGRKDGNTIRLTERNVSREHAKLLKRNGGVDAAGASVVRYILEDLTSYNGVYVNGLRVAEAQELAHGDLVQIGDYRIVLQDDAAAEVEAAAPPDNDDLKATIPQVSGLLTRSELLLQQPNRLIMLAGPTPGSEYPLIGDRFTIGRAEDASISVNHNSVSRLHCEVHALGEGRFEIVDKGSSNGVRLNGADLRRGIIEAGDIIELGDVKFKFVGQGQIFRPGASESQQLAAISNRTASMITNDRPRSGIVRFAVLGAIVGLAVAGWLWWHPRSESSTSPPPQPTSAQVGTDMSMLLEAKRLYDNGEWDAAHQRASQLPDGSPARLTEEFRDIEFKWATTMLLRVDSEPDVTIKRALLERIVQTPSVDTQVRSTATDRLAALDVARAASVRDSGKAAVATSAAPVHSSTSRPQPLDTIASVPPTPSHPTPTIPKPPSSTSPKLSPSQLTLSDNPADWQKARDMLEPKVYGGRGSSDDVRLLKSICKRQGDRTCVETCKGFETP